MTKTNERAIRAKLKQLRADWRRWRNAKTDDPGRIDLDLVCPTGRNAYRKGKPVVCGDPTCEGCASTLYRADKLAAIEAEALAVKAGNQVISE